MFLICGEKCHFQAFYRIEKQFLYRITSLAPPLPMPDATTGPKSCIPFAARQLPCWLLAQPAPQKLPDASSGPACHRSVDEFPTTCSFQTLTTIASASFQRLLSALLPTAFQS